MEITDDISSARSALSGSKGIQHFAWLMHETYCPWQEFSLATPYRTMKNYS